MVLIDNCKDSCIEFTKCNQVCPAAKFNHQDQSGRADPVATRFKIRIKGVQNEQNCSGCLELPC